MINRLPNALKQTVLYGASIALMKGVSLLMLPFIAHQLTTEDYGRLEVVSSLAIIGSILVGMGLEDALYRFAGATKERLQRRRVAAEIFGLALVIGSIAWMLGWVIADTLASWIPGNPTGYQVRLVLSVLALEGCIAIPLGWLRMRNKAVSFFLATTGRALLQAVLILLLLSAGRGIEGVLEAGLIAAIMQAMMLAYLHIRDTGIGFSRKIGGRALVYSLPIVASGLVAFSLNGLDRWILAEYASLDDVARFGIAAKFALAAVLLLQPFGMWWSPRRFSVLNGQSGKEKAARFGAIGIVLILAITVLVGLGAPVLIKWLLPETYALAGQYAVGLVIAMAFKEMTGLIDLGCFTGNTTGTQFLINAFGAITGIVCMFLWVPDNNVWGVIYALITAQFLRLVLFFIASQYYLSLPYPVRPLLLLATISLAWLALGAQSTNIYQQLLLCFLGTGFLLLSAFRLKLISMPVIASQQQS